jgi:drug/metabolite transporter (DMT)-like permease
MTASGILHGLVYAAYVWLVASVGAVFASQVAYAVTLFAVIWSIIFLKEPQSPYLWGALICMMLGMSLVSPRKRNTDVKHV